MSDTIFIDKSVATPIVAAWLNDVNVTTYQVLGAAGVAPTTAAQVRTNLGLPTPSGGSFIGIKRTLTSSVASTLALWYDTAWVNVKTDFAAKGDGTTDDTTDLQTAINSAAAVGQKVYLPPGTYKYTTTLTLPNGIGGIVGCGYGSVLAPSACDGLTFANQGTYAGGRNFSGFLISGTGTGTNNNGIICNFTAASGNRITSCHFSDIGIQGFQVGVYARGMWQCTFSEIFLYNCFYGWWFHGQNIQCTVENSFSQLGTATGTGNSYGVFLDSISSESSQSIRLSKVGVISYTVGIYEGLGFALTVEACDISDCYLCGVEITTSNSGVVIRDNWIQLHATAGATAAGVQIDAVGTSSYDKIIIDGNNIHTDGYYAGQVGVRIGNAQNSVHVTNNRIGSGGINFDIGVDNSVANGSSNAIIKNNTISATTTAIKLGTGSTDNEVGPNEILSGAPLAFASLTPAGLSYYARGSFVGTLTGMTAGTAGTVNWVANGHTVTLTCGIIQGTSNATTMTMTGLPAYLWPVSNQTVLPMLEDAGNNLVGRGDIAAASGVITFYKDQSGNGFTATGLKGAININVSYPYL
jgi:hypothetical protein